MPEQIIIITPSDKIQTLPYSDFDSLQDAVNGYPELCGKEEISAMSSASDDEVVLPILYFRNSVYIVLNDV